MAHIHEKIDFTASVYIVRDGKVLLHKHKTLDIWLPPGGHIELDEDPNQAAIREVKEETGLDVQLVGETKQHDSPYGAQDLIPPRFLNRHFIDVGHSHEHIDMAYFGRAPLGEPVPEEGGREIRWFSKDEIESGDYEIIPDIRGYALTALHELSS